MNESPWAIRIASACREKESWEFKFKCATLYDYFEGFHWKSKNMVSNGMYSPYQLNLFFSTIEIKKATLGFQNPQFDLKVRPGIQEWDPDMAAKSRELKENVLNAIVCNDETFFTDNLELALQDSFFRFGLIEYGYAADFRNPQLENIELNTWEDSSISEEKSKVLSRPELAIKDRFYVKRINPETFVTSVSLATEMRDCEWVGYYEYIKTQQLKNTKGIAWPTDNKDQFLSGEYSTAYSQDVTAEIRKSLSSGAVSKVWHIFDNVSKTRKLVLDGYPGDPLWEDEMHFLPLEDLRWVKRKTGFYPIPQTFNWIYPQDEINESREQTRSYRKRFTRKFQSVRGQVDEDEKEKMVSGPDGTIIEVNQPDAIQPIKNPDSGTIEREALIVAKDDFNIISGTSAEARGQSDRETATQARIKDMRSRTIESSDQIKYADFIARIGSGILKVAQTEMAVGIWTRIVDNSKEEIFTDMQINGETYKYITSQELNDGYDHRIKFSVKNFADSDTGYEYDSFVRFNTMLKEFPNLSMSPTVIREAANQCGYKNEKVIRELQQAAAALLVAKMQQGQQQNNSAQATNPATIQNLQMQSPTQGQVSNQLQSQLGVGG